MDKARYFRFLTYNKFGVDYISKYLEKESHRISEKWLNRIHIISPENFPIIEWEKDSKTSEGCYSFYSLDQYSDDCRNFLMSSYADLPCDKDLWWMSQFSNKYIFKPEYAPSPRYHFTIDYNKATYKTGKELDTWVYLPSKKPQPNCYSIEFDYLPITEMKETLQFDFCMQSLAKRFRFNLENNKTLKFDVVDKGFFLHCISTEKWDKYKIPLSLPLNKLTHVQFQIIHNKFAVSFDGNIKLAVEVDGYNQTENLFWALIFWNGIDKPEKIMEFEISNFIIKHKKE